MTKNYTGDLNMSNTHERKYCIPQFALTAIAFNLFFAPVWADDKSPFSYAPLHLLNPGQTEMVTHTVTVCPFAFVKSWSNGNGYPHGNAYGG